MITDKRHNLLFDNLKALTMLLVVTGHACVFYAGFGVIRFPIHPFFLFLTRLIYSFHMPLYFFISGCIYEICVQKGKYNSAGLFVRKKFLRLIIPYLFWGIAVVSPTMILLGFTDWSFPEYCLFGILLGKNTRHLWFLLSLFVMFLFTDTVRRLARTEKAKGASLIILVLFGIFSALLYHHAPGAFALGSTARCYVYFIGGTAIERFRGTKYCRKAEKSRDAGSCGEARNAGKKRNAEMSAAAVKVRNTGMPAAWKIFLPAGTALLLFWAFTGDMNSPWQRLIVGVTGIAAVFVAAESIQSHRKAVPDGRLPAALKRDSFGIYLSHPMIIYVIMYGYAKSGAAISPFLVVPVVVIIALVLSAAVTGLIRRIRLGILIGEKPVDCPARLT